MITDLRLMPCMNSKGEVSLRVKLRTDSGFYSASVPAGTSKGSSEAKDLAFEKAKAALPRIRQKIIGMQPESEKVDRLLIGIDGTKNFSRIGGNLALGISLAVARAQTHGDLWRMNGLKDSERFPLPLGNVIGGGSHGGGTDWQEFLLIPHLAKSPQEAISNLVEAWSAIGEELKQKKILQGRNLENAWMAGLDEEKTLEFLSSVANDWHMKMGVDFAASGFWDGKAYVYKKSGRRRTSEQQLDYVKEMAQKYRIFYLEDPFHENAFAYFSTLTKELGSGHLVVGDDLYCTQLRRLEKGIQEKATSGIIIKPNQVGTLFQAQNAVLLAQKHGLNPVVSHRSGETSDDWIADLSVLWGAPLIKTGVMGMERLAKHNRLIELWEEVPSPRMAEMP